MFYFIYLFSFLKNNIVCVSIIILELPLYIFDSFWFCFGGLKGHAEKDADVLVVS